MLNIGDRVRFSKEAAYNSRISPDAIYLVEELNLINRILRLRDEQSDEEMTIVFPTVTNYFIKTKG